MDSQQFTLRVKEAISYSRYEALRLGCDYIGVEHIVLGMLRQRDNVGVAMLIQSKIWIEELKAILENDMRGGEPIKSDESLKLTKEAERVIRESVLQAKKVNVLKVDCGCCLLAMLKVADSFTSKTLATYSLFYNKALYLYDEINHEEKVAGEISEEAAGEEPKLFNGEVKPDEVPEQEMPQKTMAAE